MGNIRGCVSLIRTLYKETDHPSDPLIRNRRALKEFTAKLGVRAGQQFSLEEVAAELERIRKDKKGTGGLPRLRRLLHGSKRKSKAKVGNRGRNNGRLNSKASRSSR